MIDDDDAAADCLSIFKQQSSSSSSWSRITAPLLYLHTWIAYLLSQPIQLYHHIITVCRRGGMMTARACVSLYKQMARLYMHVAISSSSSSSSTTLPPHHERNKKKRGKKHHHQHHHQSSMTTKRCMYVCKQASLALAEPTLVTGIIFITLIVAWYPSHWPALSVLPTLVCMLMTQMMVAMMHVGGEVRAGR